VREDGVGPAPKALADTRRWGVMGLCERAAHFGERVGIETAPGRGTTARLVLPNLPLDQPPERPAAPDRRAS
jgi:signal transduction histidine kinase